MLAKRIIPCLDVTGGRVVKGVNFVNLRDAGDTVELADRYNRDGADELVFLDITASSDAREIMADVVARTARQVFIPLAVGGGIRGIADARRILLSGADKVSVNTAADGFDLPCRYLHRKPAQGGTRETRNSGEAAGMIIPCIELMDGKVVQLVQGREKALEGGSADEMLRKFAAFPEIQVIDLDAAIGRGSNDEPVRMLASKAITRVGGGVRSVQRAKDLLYYGAHRVI